MKELENRISSREVAEMMEVEHFNLLIKILLNSKLISVNIG